MSSEELIQWLAGFISAKSRNSANPRPSQDQWNAIVHMTKKVIQTENDNYAIGIQVPLAT